LTWPDTDYLVPLLDGPVLRAVLAISKPGGRVTRADQRLVQDVANGAGMLLRDAQLNAELERRVLQASELAAELSASRAQLAQVRDIERHRLVTELGNATIGLLATFQADLDEAKWAIDEDNPEPDPKLAAEAARRARLHLKELLDKFRRIARGVYPTVLRDQGPTAALDELARDLPRVVLLTGKPARRLAWEVESSLYFLVASAMSYLAGEAAQTALRVELTYDDQQLRALVEDSTPIIKLTELRERLAHDSVRLTALGGDITFEQNGVGALALRAWVPDALQPQVGPPQPDRPAPGTP
jgi:signal transduction histidine kinase